MRHRGDSIRRLTAFLLFLILVLAGCRTEAERSDLARVPGVTSDTAGVRDAAVRPRRPWSGSERTWSAMGGSLAVSPDGGGPAGSLDLRTVSVSGGSPIRIANVLPLGYADPRLDPAGRRIAFLSGESRGEIWAMDGPAGYTTNPTETGGSR